MNLVIDGQRLRTWAKIALLLFYFFVFGNWIILFTSPDEGRNASAVLNMVKTWDLLLPYYNCEPRFEKTSYALLGCFSHFSGLWS